MTNLPTDIDEILEDLCDAGCRINGDTADGYGDYHTCKIPEVKQAIALELQKARIDTASTALRACPTKDNMLRIWLEQHIAALQKEVEG